MSFKKKDPYLAVLEFYYDCFPEAVTYDQAYEFFYNEGYINKDELKYFNSKKPYTGKLTASQQKEAKLKKVRFNTIFEKAGDNVTFGHSSTPARLLNPEHYFHRLEYIELMEARKSSRLAFWASITAILISFFALNVSLFKPIEISENQIETFTTSVKAIQDTNKRNSNTLIKTLNEHIAFDEKHILEQSKVLSDIKTELKAQNKKRRAPSD